LCPLIGIIGVQADLKITGIKGWRRKTQDRSEWMRVVREAEVKLRDRNAIEEEKDFISL
jgi:hypothetical protein